LFVRHSGVHNAQTKTVTVTDTHRNRSLNKSKFRQNHKMAPEKGESAREKKKNTAITKKNER